MHNPAADDFARFFEPDAVGGGKQLHRTPFARQIRQLLAHGEQGFIALVVGQFVAFGERNVNRARLRHEPLNHLDVQIGQTTANVNHQHQAFELVALLQIRRQQTIPMVFDRQRGFGIAITR